MTRCEASEHHAFAMLAASVRSRSPAAPHQAAKYTVERMPSTSTRASASMCLTA